tara:strand:+ start:182 stop:700 length:519 start_codon:yes stop_codon:yes gene_type:complete
MSSIILECPDLHERTYKSEGADYTQKCGGWLDPDTGQVYAIANWGSDRYWKNIEVNIYDSSTGMRSSKPVWKHGFGEQMAWYFEQKGIDMNALEAITFIWSGACQLSYTLMDGPQKHKHVSESLPAMIPREMMYGVEIVENHGNIAELMNVVTTETPVEVQTETEWVVAEVV